MSEQPEIIGTCIYCGGPIFKGEKYRKALLSKDKYYHERCAQLFRAKALAVYSFLNRP